MNSQQLEVIESTATKKIVIAGPGSGKTTTLIADIVRRPNIIGDKRIIILSFTTAAAIEIRKRIEEKAPEVIQDIAHCGTLDSFMLKSLRSRHNVNYAVASEETAIDVLKATLKHMSIKASLSSLEILMKLPHLMRGSGSGTKEELAVFTMHRTLEASGMMTFDRIRAEALELWMNHPPECWRLYVDEFQDSEESDLEAYSLIKADYVFYVGDPDQAIYGFRGMSAYHISNMRFLKDSRMFHLSLNYRSCEKICRFASGLISHNQNRISGGDATISAGNSIGGGVTISEAPDPSSEIAKVWSDIVAMVHSGISTIGECAILARTNWLAKSFGDFLKAQGIQVDSKSISGMPADWPRFKAIMSLWRSPWNDLIAGTVLGFSVSEEIVAETRRMARLQGKTVFEVAFSECNPGMSWKEFAIRHRVSPDSIAIGNLIESTIGLDDPDEFVRECQAWRPESCATPGVFVGTAHSAKGREWDHVWVVGCEEGLFPSLQSEGNIDEERRVFYVAVTRARKTLNLSYSTKRPLRLGGDRVGPMQSREKSRFIQEGFNR